MPLKGIRAAKHADSWYEGDPDVLSQQLDDWLAKVPSTLHNSNVPIPNARVIIGPHAGYSYSGSTAAWAYKCLNLNGVKHVFVLGPSHTYYLRGCALTKFAKWATPLGDLTVDEAIIEELRATGKFADIPSTNDVQEHSMEMHIPYLYKRITQTFSSEAEYPTIVPILVGTSNNTQEKEFGRLLAPYLRNPENAFIVSSDFCHWGYRFDYMAYLPGDNLESLQQLQYNGRAPESPTISEGIGRLDIVAMSAIKTGQYDVFANNIARTGNTVCGRHPIGVTMAALEVLANEGSSSTAAPGARDPAAVLAVLSKVKSESTVRDQDEKDYKAVIQALEPEQTAPERYHFGFVHYRRSSGVDDVDDSSVSYGAAYAVV